MYVAHPCNITVTYEEMHGSPQVSIDRDKVIETKRLKCSWDDRYTLAKELMGWTEQIGLTTVYHLPHMFIPSGWLGYIVCTDIVSMKGFAKLVDNPADTKIAEYNHAILTVRYETPEYDVTQVPLVTERIEPTAEFLTLNNSNLYWDAAHTEPIEDIESPSVMVKLFDWVYTLHRMPYVPYWVEDLVGFVNSNIVYSRKLNRFFAPGCLLFGDPDVESEHTVIGTEMWRITIRLTARAVAWNLFPRPNKRDAWGNMLWYYIYNEYGQVVYPHPYTSFYGIII